MRNPKTTREDMNSSFQRRRNGIVGDCKQLKTDVDSYNQYYNPGEYIQTVFDFREDLEELDAAVPIRKTSAIEPSRPSRRSPSALPGSASQPAPAHL